MRPIQYKTDKVEKLFLKHKTLNYESIRTTLGTEVRKTVLRKLRKLRYHSSYSHCGRYYTLDKIVRFDEYGLWSHNRIYFSRYGTLLNTIHNLIDTARQGYFASELRELLHVRVYDALRILYNRKEVVRRQIGSEYLYLSVKNANEQLENRKEIIESAASHKELFFLSEFDSPNARNCLETFLSVLNEKQRRLYVAFESMKIGRGGDQIMSKITGMNVRTISMGRQQLLSHAITADRIREPGAGRPSLKKNRNSEND